MPPLAWLSSWNLLLLLPLFGFLPLLYMEGLKLWILPHFQFFPLAIGFALWQMLERATPGRVDRLREGSGGALRFAGAICGIYGLWIFSPFVVHIAAVLVFLGWAIGTIANESSARLLGVASLIVICIPLPGNLDKTLIQLLQSQSSIVCENVLDAIGVVHIRNGNVIQLDSKHLFVEEACSGVDSLYALAAVALAMLVYQRTPLLPSLVTMMTVPFWAIMGNLLRLITITLAIQWFGIDLSGGWNHQLLGLIVFAIVSCCHLATAHSLRCLFMHVDGSIGRVGGLAIYNAIATWPHAVLPNAETGTNSSSCVRWVFMSLTAVCCVLGAFALPLVQCERIVILTPELPKELEELMPNDTVFENESHGLRKVQYQRDVREKLSTFGMYSHSWIFSDRTKHYLLSLDFPFWDYHDLAVCYKATGWSVLEEKQFDRDESTGVKFLKQMELKNELGEYAYVWFVSFDLNGEITPFPHHNLLRDRQNLYSRLTRPVAAWRELSMKCQLQIMLKSQRRLADIDILEGRRLYAKFLADVLQKSKPALHEIKKSFR